MKNCRKISHSVYDLKYHLVWITKYRKPVSLGTWQSGYETPFGKYASPWISKSSQGTSPKIMSTCSFRFLRSCPLGKSWERSRGKHRKLLTEYRRLAKEFWGRHLWGRGYFAPSSGNVTYKVIMQYIATQDLEERSHDGDFTIAP